MNRLHRPAPGRTLTALLLALCLSLAQILLLAHDHEDGPAHSAADCQLCLHQAGNKAGGAIAITPAASPYRFDEPPPLPFAATPAGPYLPAQARAPPAPLKLTTQTG